jgi:hypothetical protein
VQPTTTTTIPGRCEGDDQGDQGGDHGHNGDDDHGHGGDHGHNGNDNGNGQGNAWGHFGRGVDFNGHGQGQPCPQTPSSPGSDKVVTIHARTTSATMPGRKPAAALGVLLALVGLDLAGASTFVWTGRRRHRL